MEISSARNRAFSSTTTLMYNDSMTRIPALAIALLLLFSAPAHAMTDTEIQNAVNGVIAQRHPTDTADWWRSLGAGAPHVIISMYESTTHIYHRLRLLQGLGWFDDPQAVD